MATGFRTVRDGLRHWATAAPERIALSGDDASLSYADLLVRVERRASAARTALRDSPADAFLPVLVDRSVESCISVLACDYARVPFCPVDVGMPAAALAAIIGRAGHPRALLTHGGLPRQDLPDGVGVVDDESPATDDVAPQARSADDHLGLVVFTSGSTGTPKGVAFDWRTRDERWRRRIAEPRRTPERTRAVAVLPFDSAWGLDVAASIAVGYSVHVADVARLHPAGLLALLAEVEATHLDAPPQLLRLLGRLPASSVVPLPAMQFVRVGSEPLRFEFLNGLRAVVPPDTLIEHAYGASESGWVFAHRIPMSDAPQHGAAPLGGPVEGGTVRLDPVPDGDEGECEVVVSGPISQGYLGDPEQTSARFSTDADGRRWWRTGDIVSADENGVLWHRGRMDDVVKVRGKLASPSQVVAVLMAVPGIRQAVVLPHEQDHNVRLVAHVEVDPESAVTLDSVKHALARELPAHLVPSAVLRHRTLPTTDRGKVDRRLLMDGPFEPW